MKKFTFIMLLVFCAGIFLSYNAQAQAIPSVEQDEHADRVFVYTANTEDIVKEIAKAFESETGIKVEIVNASLLGKGTTNDIFKRVRSERKNPKADVVWGGMYESYINNLDLLDNYVSPNDKNVFKPYQNITTKRITVYALSSVVLLVNKDALGTIKVDGYSDLLNPALKGKIAMANPTKDFYSFSHLTSMLMDMGGNLTADAGWNYVASLLAQMDNKLLASPRDVYESVFKGNYAVGLTYEDPAFAYLRDTDANLQIVYMREGALFTGFGAALLKNAANPTNAKKFIDFLLSPTAQDILGMRTTIRPSVTSANIANYMTPLSRIKAITVDTKTLDAQKLNMVQKFKTMTQKK